MQTQLNEHLQESEGIGHQATIDRPFSDERMTSPAERDAENAAFLSRVRAATHGVNALPSSGSYGAACFLPCHWHCITLWHHTCKS